MTVLLRNENFKSFGNKLLVNIDLCAHQILAAVFHRLVIINMFNHFYCLQMITLGGDAELELVDSLDPFSEGVVFSVRPPKKSWKNIANLSGGEKVLSFLLDFLAVGLNSCIANHCV